MKALSNQVDTSNSGAICGGVVNESKFFENPYGYMMAWVMPDIQFKHYVKLKNQGKDKEASKLFDEYAWSAI